MVGCSFRGAVQRTTWLPVTLGNSTPRDLLIAGAVHTSKGVLARSHGNSTLARHCSTRWCYGQKQWGAGKESQQPIQAS